MPQIDESTADTQRHLQSWARVVGILYVATNITAMIGFYARSSGMLSGDAAATAERMLRAETLFRVGITFELITVAGVLVLVAGLHTILSPVGRGLALCATFWRLAENLVAAMLPLSSAAALAIAVGGGGVGQPLQQQALAYVFFPGVYGFGWNIAFFFLGLGSSLFSYLWWKSGYIPAAIAVWGVFASLVLAVASLALIGVPGIGATLRMMHMAPIGIYEFGLGFWLIFARLRTAKFAVPQGG